MFRNDDIFIPLDNLQLVVVSLFDSLSIQPEVIVLTEMWLTEHDADIANFDGYCAHHVVRPSRRGGGVSIFCASSIISE